MLEKSGNPSLCSSQSTISHPPRPTTTNSSFKRERRHKRYSIRDTSKVTLSQESSVPNPPCNGRVRTSNWPSERTKTASNPRLTKSSKCTITACGRVRRTNAPCRVKLSRIILRRCKTEIVSSITKNHRCRPWATAWRRACSSSKS